MKISKVSYDGPNMICSEIDLDPYSVTAIFIHQKSKGTKYYRYTTLYLSSNQCITIKDQFSECVPAITSDILMELRKYRPEFRVKTMIAYSGDNVYILAGEQDCICAIVDTLNPTDRILDLIFEYSASCKIFLPTGDEGEELAEYIKSALSSLGLSNSRIYNCKTE